NTGIAYLVRRLDENTSSENFLHSSFGMRPGDSAFIHERQRFLDAVERVDSVDETPRRERKERPRLGRRAPDSLDFRNEPDSDFANAATRAAFRAVLAEVQAQDHGVVRSCIAGSWVDKPSPVEGVDPSRPGLVPYRIALASSFDVERALSAAHEDAAG